MAASEFLFGGLKPRKVWGWKSLVAFRGRSPDKRSAEAETVCGHCLQILKRSEFENVAQFTS